MAAQVFVDGNEQILVVAALHPQPEGGVVIRVVGVPSLNSAPEMRRSLLLGIADQGWVCPDLKRITNLACLAAELLDVRDRLIPSLLDSPDPFQDVLKLKNSGWLVRFLGQEDYAGDGQQEQGALWAASTPLSNRMLRIARRYLEGVKEEQMRGRLPDLGVRITQVLEVPVALPPPPVQVQDEEEDEGQDDDD